MQGKNTLGDKGNYRYWQAFNARHLLALGLDEKIFPHRVNSTGKLQDIWSDGFRAFETDIIFDYKSDGLFYVGHHDGVMGDDLETFLAGSDYRSIKKAWFDFKNLDEGNAERALDELERLDKKFNLKAIVVLESGWTAAGFSAFRRNGWHASYYLPTDVLVAAQDKNVAGDLDLLAAEIAAQVKEQQVSAVSFDDRLYPFVKTYLEGLLPQELVYHVWYGPKLASPTFADQIANEEIYQDERIKTFLCTYKSNFDL